MKVLALLLLLFGCGRQNLNNTTKDVSPSDCGGEAVVRYEFRSFAEIAQAAFEIQQKCHLDQAELIKLFNSIEGVQNEE